MKNIITLITLLLLTSMIAKSQCTIVPVSLEKNIKSSDLVIEAKIISKKSYWNLEKNFIYTANELEVWSVYKGEVINNRKKCIVITEGGVIGLEMLKVEPSLELTLGEQGVFMLKESSIKLLYFEGTLPVYKGSMSVQSFIHFDEIEKTAHAYYKKYASFNGDFVPELIKYCGQNPIIIKKKGKQQIQPLATPSISSLTNSSLSSGTGSILTINGSNFGATQGSGSVAFKDANYGDGRYYTTRFSSSIVSWSNSQIKVKVPTRAGTGIIRVTNNNNESGTSSGDVDILYAHSNVVYSNSTIDSAYFKIKHINDNTNGGYTWQMNTKFAAKTDAVNTFLRSAEEWRCETLMNWDIGSNTTTDAIARDNINLVRFTKFSDSRLGVCYSWYNGCFSSSKVYWFVSELDIEFDSTRAWYYGTGTPPSNKFDFQSVATHELGHGHQLSHVRDNKKTMHYSIGKGQRKADLSTNDINGGKYVKDQSLITIPCNSKKYKPLLVGKCNLTKPIADFSSNSTEICPNTNIVVTNKSEGNIDVYAWTFGVDASIPSSSATGPFNISYSTSGAKTIQLIVSNSFGNDTMKKIITVLETALVQPDTLYHLKEYCLDSTGSYSIDDVVNATEYKWTLNDGGTFVGSTTERSVHVKWNKIGGPYTLGVDAKSACGSTVSTSATVTVLENATAAFDYTEEGRKITFSSTGVGATSFSWDFGDGNTSTDKNPVHTYATKGNYIVNLSTSNSCSDATTSKTVNVNFGASILYTENGYLKLFPNPSNGTVQLVSTGMELHSIIIIDELGRKVLDQRILNNSSVINLTKNAAGLYSYLVRDNNGKTYTGSLIVK